MGVPHLEKLRDYLEKNKGESFTRTMLRDLLKQNFGTVQQNLSYLIARGEVLVKIEKGLELYQWKKK